MPRWKEAEKAFYYGSVNEKALVSGEVRIKINKNQPKDGDCVFGRYVFAGQKHVAPFEEGKFMHNPSMMLFQ